MKLTLMYTLIRKLCEGAIKAIAATQGQSVVPSKLPDLLCSLSTLPAWVGLVKRSACRIGMMRGLELAKSYHLEMKSELLAGGFPELKVDGSPFSENDCIKETRLFATKIVDEMDL